MEHPAKEKYKGKKMKKMQVIKAFFGPENGGKPFEGLGELKELKTEDREELAKLAAEELECELE